MRRLLERLPLRLREIVAVVVTLCLGYLVTSHVDVVNGDQPAFVRSVHAGGTAHLSYADVQLLDVRTAKQLVPPISSDPVVTASGVFVVALVRVVATREPTYFFGTWLEDDDGVRYLASKRSGCDNTPYSGTGAPAWAMLCFDVPAGRLADYRLEVARGVLDTDSLRQDDVADVDLGLDPHASATSPTTDAAYQVVTTESESFELQTATVTEAP